jgi:mannose-6-phosphate isomerase
MPASALQTPLRFERLCLEKVWGGRALESVLGIALPDLGPIGETWEVSDRREHISRVASGPWKGSTLRDLMRDHRAALLGESRSAADGSFPLLIKLLDASEALSIQVHPHPLTRKAGEETKTESWYILAASPEAKLYLGLRPGVTREMLAAHAGQRSILDCIEEYSVRAGDFLFVPAGTVHAIGGGITLIEIQENADTTYRLYDWDRLGLDGRPRALKIEDSLRVTRFGIEPLRGPFQPRCHEVAPGHCMQVLCREPEFAVELHELEGARMSIHEPRAQLLILLEGELTLEHAAGAEQLRRGDVLVVPAACIRPELNTRTHARYLRAIAP